MRRGSPWKVLAATLAVTAGLVACSSAGGSAPGTERELVAAGSAPDAAPDVRDSSADGAVNPLDRIGATPPAADGDPGTTAGAGTPTPTPGQSSAASQPTGRGYVDTAVENRLPGTPGWRAVHTGRHSLVEGFADATSVGAGQPLRLFVSSTAPTFRIQVLRLGWYGGVGARQLWMSVPVRGGVQNAPYEDESTRMITAPWQASATVPTAGLVAGDYVAKLLGSDGASSFVPFAVHEQRSTGAVVLVNSTLTWLAYNPWGGANSYTASEAESKEEGYDGRSVVSSMDRPFTRGDGTGGLLGEEYNLLQTAERMGLRLNYVSDLDLHGSPELLQGATGIALLGHSEYWSRQMRAVLEAARDSGVNLAFLGANDVYRRVRLVSAQTGPFRLMVNYKDGTQDPIKDENTTADWPHEPHKRPQASVTGVQYRCARARADMVVTDPDGWLFRGLGLKAGQKLPGMIGNEFDRVALSLPTPRPIQIMAHSPVRCYGDAEYSDLVWYTTPQGAGVFAAGTLNWNAGIADPNPTTRAVVTAVTERVYAAMAQPRVGLAIPAVDNAATWYTPTGHPRTSSSDPVVGTGAGLPAASPSAAGLAALGAPAAAAGNADEDRTDRRSG